MSTRHFILLVAVIALATGTAFSDVYLSTTGNNANDGLTVGTPKLTLSAALGVFNTQAAPTTLHIAAGAYTENGVFNVTPVGTAVNAVTIQGDAGTITLNQSVLRVGGAYTTVKNLVINAQAAHEACVVVQSSAANCTIQNCSMTGVLEGTEHFNPDVAEIFEPVDVAPVQVLAAANCTITGCTFINNNTATIPSWDDAILMPSAIGGAGNLTVSGCFINGSTATGGIQLLRQSNNTQVLNTTIRATYLHAFQIWTGPSPNASGNSDTVLIQDTLVDGCLATLSQEAAVRFMESLVTNITMRRCTMLWDPTANADGFSITGCTVVNVLLDRVTFTHNYPAVGDYCTTIRQTDAGRRAYCTNFQMVDCNVVGGNFQQLFNADVDGYIFTRVHCVARSNWINTNFAACTVNVKNWVLTDCTYQDNVRTGGYGFTLGGVQINIDGFTMTRCDMRQTFGYHNLCILPTGGSRLKNFYLTDSRLEANSCAFFILGSTADNININNCLIGGGAACVLFQEWGGYRPQVHDLTIANTILRNSTFTNDYAAVDFGTPADQAGYNACVSFRDSGILIDRATMTNITMTGTKGFFVNGNLAPGISNPNDEKRNIKVTNVTANVVREGILSSGSSTQKNWTFTNCSFTSSSLNGVDVDASSSWDNVNFQNCSFTGGQGFQSAGFFMENTSIINNATFNGCQFACSSTVNDVTEKRTAGFLMEDQGTTLSRAGFSNCTFSGRNVALAWQRWQIQNGPALFPIVQNVQVKDCTMVASTDRAISLQYLVGNNAVFQNVAIQGNPAYGIYADVNGNAFKFINVSYNGGGTARGAYLGSSLDNESSGWLMQNCSLTNLNGIGIQISKSLKTSTFDGVVLSGVPGSSHGVYVDNSLASTPGAKQVTTLTIRNCVISGFGGDGLRVNGPSHTLQGNSISSVGGDGIHLLDDSALRAVNTLVQCASNTIADCVGTGIVLEGQNHTISYNRILRDGQGIRVRSGILRSPGQVITKNNTVTRNLIYGSSIPTGTGLWEALNPAITNDPGPSTNTYLNNTVTDWAQGSEFRGANNKIWNNIFFFNAGTGLRVRPSGLAGLRSGWNCSQKLTPTGNQFDGLFIDYAKDIWYNPSFSSRNPIDPDFYLLGPGSGCRDRGTTTGILPDGHTDLGAIESGASEVATWRLY